LRYFAAVADELHFGRAAERLHVAQPAVSQQIARLERELGVLLFDRSARRVRLTAAGRRVLDAAQEALAAADRVRLAARASAGTMRIGTAAGVTTRLERGIDALRGQAPPFDVVLVDLPLAARLSAMRQGELDVALARGPLSAPGLRVLPTWTEPLVAIVSTHHRAADRAAIGVSELSGGVLRLPARQDDPALHDALREAGVHPQLGRPTGTLQHTIVEVGFDPDSWAVLPSGQAAEIRSTRVKAIPLEPPATITGSVVIPEHLPARCASAHVAAFGDAATER
jgi:DNA-binding transcriptional LysR family regulator